jgi:D-apiose dehydrogenase
MSSKRKGLVVGAGYFSQFHFDAWNRMSDVEIVGVCDLDERRARAAADKYSIESYSTDLSEALSRTDLDFVDIATTPHSRIDIVARVLQRKIPIICQKPLANTYRGAVELLDMVQTIGIPFMVHENFRFQPWYREIKRILNNGWIGRNLHTIHMRTRTGDGWGENAYLDRQPYFRDMPRLLIHETGIHFVDTFRYLAGEITECTADVRRLNHRIRGEDAGLLQFVFENGARGVWDANRYNEPRIPCVQNSNESAVPFNPRYTFGELLVEADGGSVWLASDGSITYKPIGQPTKTHHYPHSQAGFGGDCVFATQRHFIDVLDGNATSETSPEEYRKSLRVVEALYESARERQSIRVGSAKKNKRVIDLSLPVSPSMAGVQISDCRTIGRDGWNATTLNLYSHAGTHMDAPRHFLEDGKTLETLDLSQLCGRARIVNVAPATARMLIGVEDVLKAIGFVEPEDRLLFRTDWYSKFGTAEYRNELPRISIELARWLVKQRVALIGVEPPSVADVNNMNELTIVHQTLFRGGVIIVEGLANLDQLKQPEVEFIALPLRIIGGDGCPVRAIAMESEGWQ